MECQKIIKLLDNTPNQPSKFSIKNWVEINDDTRGKYNTNSLIKLNTKMLKVYVITVMHALVKGNLKQL